MLHCRITFNMAAPCTCDPVVSLKPTDIDTSIDRYLNMTFGARSARWR